MSYRPTACSVNFMSLSPLAFLLIPATLLAAPAPPQTDVFRAGEGGYATYRIPALIVSPKGTLLAFCEGRRNSGADTGDIDVLLRRSSDHGKTWAAVQKIADQGEDTIGNPTPVVERKSGAILLLLTSNPGRVTERETGPRDRSVWILRSTDDGATWSRARRDYGAGRKQAGLGLVRHRSRQRHPVAQRPPDHSLRP